ncbi:HAD family hydrolase [Streptomyces sp. NPDC004647]|uniref:HAD family hydrolase n=1 Tax=Streptomyces sp. NPDC004647 TaxID=3154671 RepID=UPI0033A41A7A
MTSELSSLFSSTLHGNGAVLFDFDGPMADLFAARRPGGPRLAPEIARLLEKVLVEYELPVPVVKDSDDPHELYRAALDVTWPPGEADRVAGLRRALRDCLDEQESAAAETSVPTPGAKELVELLHSHRVPLAITSNNSEPAIRAHLDRVDLRPYFEGRVFGRTGDHRLMKPHPDCLRRGMAAVGHEPERCLLIGDSVSDVEAAATAGAQFCGYARGERKAGQLRAAGARVVASSMWQIRQAVESAADAARIRTS